MFPTGTNWCSLGGNQAVNQQTAVSEVTDADVLSALLEQEVVSMASVIQDLALHMLEAA